MDLRSAESLLFMYLAISGGLVWMFALSSPVAAQVSRDWQMPVIIEAVKTVLVRVPGGAHPQRGTLDIPGQPGFSIEIPKGQRFAMTKVLGEGGCTIAIDRREFDASSCPWLDGFTDHEADFFRIVSPVPPSRPRRSPAVASAARASDLCIARAERRQRK